MDEIHENQNPSNDNILTLYQIMVESINTTKRFQAQFSYYIILMYILIVYSSSDLIPDNQYKNFSILSFFFLALFIATIASSFLYKFELDLRKYRRNLTKIYYKLPESLREFRDFYYMGGASYN